MSDAERSSNDEMTHTDLPDTPYDVRYIEGELVTEKAYYESKVREVLEQLKTAMDATRKLILEAKDDEVRFYSEMLIDFQHEAHYLEMELHELERAK